MDKSRGLGYYEVIEAGMIILDEMCPCDWDSFQASGGADRRQNNISGFDSKICGIFSANNTLQCESPALQGILQHSKHDLSCQIHHSSHPPCNCRLKQCSINGVPPFAAGLADGSERSDTWCVEQAEYEKAADGDRCENVAQKSWDGAASRSLRQDGKRAGDGLLCRKAGEDRRNRSPVVKPQRSEKR